VVSPFQDPWRGGEKNNGFRADALAQIATVARITTYIDYAGTESWIWNF
jgi:hypothetical protein